MYVKDDNGNKFPSLTKAALEKWRDYYGNLVRKYSDTGSQEKRLYYAGMTDVLIDLLKHFEE